MKNMPLSDRVRRHRLFSNATSRVSPSQLPDDLPLSLKEACKHVFGGSISVASLKAEHRRGNLEITKIGRAYFTTPADIKAMLANCRVPLPNWAALNSSQLAHSNESRLEAARASLRLTLERAKEARKKKRDK